MCSMPGGGGREECTEGGGGGGGWRVGGDGVGVRTVGLVLKIK